MMFENYDIKEIRFLPMDNKVEFKNEKEVRVFLKNGLAKQKGKYYYHERGIDLENVDALVLFQYNSNIMGYGVFKTRTKVSPFGEIVNGEKIIYNGYNEFYVETIHNIEKISSEEFKSIDPSFKKFSQSMRKTNIQFLEQISLLIEKKRNDFEKKS